MLPDKKANPNRKWKTSKETLLLVEKRSQTWDKLDDEGKKNLKKQISRSARQDYRTHVESIVEEMEQMNSIVKTSEIFRLAKQLTSKGKTTLSTQPSVDENGLPITSTQQQLELWAQFLQNKFSAQPNEPEVVLHAEEEQEVEMPSLEEVESCVKKLKKGKAVGPDGIPVEQFHANDRACRELHDLILTIFESEEVPEELVLGDMMMIYKKKDKNDRANYRALGLLNHSYKVFSMVLLTRIVPYIEPRLSDMQAGFRSGRGCRDNILILMMSIQHLLRDKTAEDESAGVITYIEFVAAFDSINHSYMFESLKLYGVPLKYIRLVNSIYCNAAVRVRHQGIGGCREYSRAIPIRRGAIQGDIPLPVVFLVALDRLLKQHGGLDTNLPITPSLSLSDLEFADDAALANTNSISASERMTVLSENSGESGLQISLPKTKVQHIRKRPIVSPTTEQDIEDLPPEKKFKHECTACGMTYPTNHGLAVHKGRHCKGKKTAKKPSRRGTVADRIVTQLKVEKFQAQLPVVKMGTEDLENVYDQVYLGADIAGDGDQRVAMNHRCNIAWGRFNEHRKVLTTTKLPLELRLRLYAVLIISTMIYGCCAWLLTDDIKRSLRGHP